MKQYQGSLWSTPAAAAGDSSLHFRQLSFSHCTHILFTNSLLPRAGPIGMVLIIRLACCFILFWFRFVFVLFCFSEVIQIWKIKKNMDSRVQDIISITRRISFIFSVQSYASDRDVSTQCVLLTSNNNTTDM